MDIAGNPKSSEGAGHFVKTVHNGIGYADMQLLAEAYHIMKEVLNMGPSDIAEVSSLLTKYYRYIYCNLETRSRNIRFFAICFLIIRVLYCVFPKRYLITGMLTILSGVYWKTRQKFSDLRTNLVGGIN